jgi:hyperosmotically inducible periplasmic protein
MRIERTSYALAVCAALALGMSGCAAFKGDGNGATAAKQTTDTSANPRGPVTTVSDATINSKVKATLAADELVKARNIDVDTVRGVVTMNGTVNSAAEKSQAINLAKKVEGVVDVKDNLKVAG